MLETLHPVQDDGIRALCIRLPDEKKAGKSASGGGFPVAFRPARGISENAPVAAQCTMVTSLNFSLLVSFPFRSRYTNSSVSRSYSGMFGSLHRARKYR